MTAADLEKLAGQTISHIEYEEGSTIAYIITARGDGVEISVEPTFNEEEE